MKRWEGLTLGVCNRCGERPITAEHGKLCDICRRTCSKCNQNRKAQRSHYCLECKAAYARENRPRYSALSEEAKHKSRARAYANMYLRRGLIERKGCEVCGEKAQMHHEDYNKPLRVRFLCSRHHQYLHHPLPDSLDGGG